MLRKLPQSFIVSITLILLLFSSNLLAEPTDSKSKTIEAGNDTFYRFCSVCHGKDAQGNGPFASNLKVPPSDLTILNKKYESFPWLYLYEVIDGKDIDEHGTKEMPIWGDIFDLSQWPNEYTGFSEVIVRGRIFELLVYLESIQKD